MVTSTVIAITMIVWLAVTVLLYQLFLSLVEKMLNRAKTQILRVKLGPGAKMPTQANPFAAGYDLFCLEDTFLHGHETKKLRTGVSMEIPTGMFGMIRPRGSAMIRGLAIQGTIDSDYRGEIFVVAHNTTSAPVLIQKDSAVAQMILTPYLSLTSVLVEGLSETERGEGAFGSTGNK